MLITARILNHFNQLTFFFSEMHFDVLLPYMPSYFKRFETKIFFVFIITSALHAAGLH